MKSRIGFTSALAAAISIGAGFARVPRDKAYLVDAHSPQTKSGGGKGGAVRIYTPEAYAWRKAFSGIAVPRYIELSSVTGATHDSVARGPRPNTFAKQQRRTA